ncbi:hypothetical protein [Corynebacterium sp.]|uniref:hypothetical protein n=1 Tax=Corynebacterium sp. TaxID=1720 RepID=UPI002A908D90|nr:hypothetical protein [Corynebacterium sp.]MDY5786301.1 hypothetical protein [Corynebacterium sp.]
MPIIQFDVLVPDAQASEVAAAFQRALDILVKRDMLDSGSAEHAEPPLIDASTTAQLEQVYRTDRGSEPADDGARVHRFLIQAHGVDSYNRLAMGLSRILTPKADLPNDPVALMMEERFEVASIYPWTVEIRR